MNSIACIFSLTCAILLKDPLIPAPNFAAEPIARVFIIDGASLTIAKQRIQQNDPLLKAALAKLRRDADRALISAPLSIMRKDSAPPSGDKHDYMSLAPYWWPNPNTDNGLPYVRRDGEINPERNRIADRQNLENIVTLVKTLALAYYFTANEDYAKQATTMLQVWFLDPLTRMNPHLKYAQGIPGRTAGRPAGIIESHNLPELVDAAGLLAGSGAWTEAHQRQLQLWFIAFLTWLLESAQGRTEAQAENNHGTWYDVQVASFALFTEKKDLARGILGESVPKRIARQIDPDGSQPRELARADSWRYSLFNLEALFDAAALGDHLAIDLWNFETADKRSIRKALAWLIPFATGEKRWPLREQSRWQPERLAPLLQRAARRYREPSYVTALGKLAAPSIDSRERLLNPMDEMISYAK